ncbi:MULTISPECIES: coproporphyrinogen III oxidase [Metabacillus]|uniref:Coproporphyrinogen III oxidase n=2 Tax=Metabacillus TaxID=2675233 RepID=A0A179SQJ1_9BACI|nr:MULTISPECIES: coproporphyrinogen III oxidase [Metabacillus]OAS84017.1 coproporphyrinogen III oxidase [Metabacillus litoralis]QNF28268.1 coproporphyrinogen III oxidase [Metabacillus sp. KUDC1714]
MKIYIKGIDDERFHRPLRLIGNLFFEETELCFTEGDATLEAEFFIEENNDGVSIKGFLRTEDGEEFVASKDQQIASHIEGKDHLRQVKNTLSYVYLTMLQDYTGMTQKWGILTGIRPTKLYHKKRQEGMPEREIHRMFKEEYLLADEKIQLMKQIVERQLQVIPDIDSLSNEVSIYIGIPFCPTKCAYCTFPAYAINGRQGSVTSFLGGLHYEMKEIGRWLKEKGIKITTVYYGGGTPTSITAEEMDMLYEEMSETFPNVENIREITVEAGRPDTITKEKLDVLNKWKIDRISINPQSYIQDTLKAIGRHHTVEETIEKFHLARTMGMNNINMDLIIGLPGEGVKEFDYTLSESAKLMPESLTVHTLSFKRASEMTKNKHKYKVASREEISTMMDHAVTWTNDHGYAPYYLYRQKNILGNLENVGYALKGQDSIYNIMIMEEQQTIIGIGCGAASKFVHPETMKITHFANPKDPKSYNDGFKHYTDEKIKILEELFIKE